MNSTAIARCSPTYRATPAQNSSAMGAWHEVKRSVSGFKVSPCFRGLAARDLAQRVEDAPPVLACYFHHPVGAGRRADDTEHPVAPRTQQLRDTMEHFGECTVTT